jgi:hypothetical protein
VTSRRHLGWTAVLALLAALAAALAFNSLVNAPPEALAKAKKKSCKPRKEQKGCKLPSGAIFSGSSSVGDIEVRTSSNGASVEAGINLAPCTPEPGNISGASRFSGKRPKVGGTITFPDIPQEEAGSVSGTVKFTTATKAAANLTITGVGGTCKGTIQMTLKREVDEGS